MNYRQNKLRSFELELVKNILKPNSRVLELGGGSGYQASLINKYGCQVDSIDIKKHPSDQSYYPVTMYDGKRIPFPDNTFDVVYSSSVLEHIRHIDIILSEIHRVLKPSGVAVHIVPNTAWRFWTSLAHYPYLIKLLFKSIFSRKEATPQSNGIEYKKHNIFYYIKKALFSGPHGEFSNAFVELYYFNKRRWSRLFQENDFEIAEDFGNSLLYTGYAIFPGAPIGTRKFLASLFGSVCHVFILRAKNQQLKTHLPEERGKLRVKIAIRPGSSVG